jgi:transposase
MKKGLPRGNAPRVLDRRRDVLRNVVRRLDLSRKRLDFHLLDADGGTVEIGAAPPDADGLHRLSERLAKPCPVSDLFGVRGRQLLMRLGLPDPWQGTLEASLRLIDELDREIGECERELRRLGADHRYVPLLCTVPGISWVLAYTIAAELGDINRFPTPRKLAGYTGLCPRVYQSGDRDLRGPLAKQGPRYLGWALVEAATHACTAPVYRDRYQQTKARIGKQRDAKVAQIDLARRLTEAIWHMLTRDQPYVRRHA